MIAVITAAAATSRRSFLSGQASAGRGSVSHRRKVDITRLQKEIITASGRSNLQAPPGRLVRKVQRIRLSWGGRQT